MVSARKFHRAGKYAKNEAYLNPEIFTVQFYEPAVKLLGPMLSGFLFEQEYQRSGDRSSPEEMARVLDAFFTEVLYERAHRAVSEL